MASCGRPAKAKILNCPNSGVLAAIRGSAQQFHIQHLQFIIQASKN
jgi:hypothetical protein